MHWCSDLYTLCICDVPPVWTVAVFGWPETWTYSQQYSQYILLYIAGIGYYRRLFDRIPLSACTAVPNNRWFQCNCRTSTVNAVRYKHQFLAVSYFWRDLEWHSVVCCTVQVHFTPVWAIHIILQKIPPSLLAEQETKRFLLCNTEQMLNVFQHTSCLICCFNI